MNFDLADEHVAVQDMLRRFCADRFPPAVARRWADRDGFDRARWKELAGLGVFELTAPVTGPGGLVDAVVALEILGAHVVPGPLAAAALTGSLDGDVATGAAVPALLDTARRPHVIDHAHTSDVIFLVTDDGVDRVDGASLVALPLDNPLDPTTRPSIVDGVAAVERVGDSDAAARVRQAHDLVVAALAIGVGVGAVARAVAHAGERRQFDRPIGSFQAVKHLLADAHVRLEVARAAVHAAAVMADDPGTGDDVRAAAGATLLAVEAGIVASRTALQVFGGMGFTWEVDCHLYVKRAWMLRAAASPSDRQLELVAQRLDGIEVTA